MQPQLIQVPEINTTTTYSQENWLELDNQVRILNFQLNPWTGMPVSPETVTLTSVSLPAIKVLTHERLLRTMDMLEEIRTYREAAKYDTDDMIDRETIASQWIEGIDARSHLSL